MAPESIAVGPGCRAIGREGIVMVPETIAMGPGCRAIGREATSECPNAGYERPRRWVLPAARTYVDPATVREW
jgi:hypothetical protein